MRLAAYAFAVAVILAVLQGCARQVTGPAGLVGVYKVDYTRGYGSKILRPGYEILTIKGDGTYTQDYYPPHRAVIRNSGTWELQVHIDSLLVLHRAMIPVAFPGVRNWPIPKEDLGLEVSASGRTRLTEVDGDSSYVKQDRPSHATP